MSPVPRPSTPRLTLYELIEQQGFLSLDSMEGAVEITAPPALEGSKWAIAPGILLACGLTAAAVLVRTLPFPPFTIQGANLDHPLGVSILAILLGLLTSSFFTLPALIKRGCKWVAFWFIPIAIVCLGAGIDLHFLTQISAKLFCAIIGIMALAMLLGVTVGKLCGLNSRTSYLLGVGTAVCGSSAILAAAPANDAEDDEILVAIGAVNIIGLLAMCGCVAGLWFWSMGPTLYGAWVGATIHAVPQVIAAGESSGSDAAMMATLVKLVRISLLAPVVIFTAFWFRRKHSSTSNNKTTKSISSFLPWFIWGFTLLAGLRILGWLPELHFEAHDQPVQLSSLLQSASKWLLAIAMAAIGLQVNIKTMVKTGSRAILAGSIVWVIIAAVGLVALRWSV